MSETGIDDSRLHTVDHRLVEQDASAIQTPSPEAAQSLHTLTQKTEPVSSEVNTPTQTDQFLYKLTTAGNTAMIPNVRVADPTEPTFTPSHMTTDIRRSERIKTQMAQDT